MSERDADMDEELRGHVARLTEQNLAAGMSPAEARRAALLKFGSIEAIGETARAARATRWLEDLLQDVRFALRTLGKSRGFTAAAVLTLALGIGVTTAIFSVVNGVLLRPLPYPESDRIVRLGENQREADSPVAAVNWANFLDWQAQQTVFERLGAWRRASYNLTGQGEPELLITVQMTAEVFPLLRVAPRLGRAFGSEDDRAGGAAVTVLSHGLWQRRFGGDPGVIGRAVTLDGRPHTVVGVMGPEIVFPGALWVPLGPVVAGWTDRGTRNGVRGIARLAPGVSLVEARAAMTAIERRLEQAYPETNRDWHVSVERLLDGQVRNVRPALWILLGAAALVLLIACANVAGLLLARALSRRREIAARVALGAGRPRIVKQLLTESLLLAGGGAALGLPLAHLGLRLILAATAGVQLPRAAEIDLDGRVLLFSAVVALFTGVLFGLAPAWQGSRVDLQSALRDGAGGSGAGRTRLRQGLVVAQVASTLILLTGAGLLLKSFHRLQQVDAGFTHEGVLTCALSLPPRRYGSPEQQIGFYRQLEERLRGLPGVSAAALATQIPLDESNASWSFVVEGRPEPPPHQQPAMEMHGVGREYFRALGIPLLRGRGFTDEDDRRRVRGTPREEVWGAGVDVVIVDEELARQQWPNQDPIGQRIRLPWGPRAEQPVMTVIGVVGHVKLERLREERAASQQAYFPVTQAPQPQMMVLLKTTASPETLLASVRAAVLALDPELPIFGVRTLAELRENNVTTERLNLVLVGIFAGVALALAVIGLYGVLAYSVAQRQREIGVRVALGAKRAEVLGLVLGQGMRLAAAGALVGIAGAVALTRVLTGLLYQVEPTDPTTFAGVTAVVLVVALLACWLPARRAAALDPMVVLRHE